jgi:DNA-directed RNA polymerase II subunit RPB2
MCPFESPDGASIGYLKNLAFLSKVAAGTDAEFIKTCLNDIGITPIEFYNLPLDRNITKVFINNTWFGITEDPINIIRILKAYRRNAFINILTSVVLLLNVFTNLAFAKKKTIKFHKPETEAERALDRILSGAPWLTSENKGMFTRGFVEDFEKLPANGGGPAKRYRINLAQA